MKNVLKMLFIFLLMLILIACNSNTSEDVPEAMGSKTNDASNVSQSSFQEEINLDWPKDKLSKNVPRLKGITITEISEIEHGIVITFTGCDQDETKMYTVHLDRAGWDFETENTEAGKTVMATIPNESLIFFSPIYDDSNDVGTITYTKTD